MPPFLRAIRRSWATICFGRRMLVDIPARILGSGSTVTDFASSHMPFQVDAFLYPPEFGLRWETGVAVKKDGVGPFSDKIQGLIER